MAPVDLLPPKPKPQPSAPPSVKPLDIEAATSTRNAGGAAEVKATPRTLERMKKVGSAVLHTPRAAAVATVRAPRNFGKFMYASWVDAADFIFEVIDGPEQPSTINLPATMKNREEAQAKMDQLLKQLREERAQARAQQGEASATGDSSSAGSTSARDAARPPEGVDGVVDGAGLFEVIIDDQAAGHGNGNGKRRADLWDPSKRRDGPDAVRLSA